MNSDHVTIKVPELLNQNYLWHSSVIPTARIEEYQKIPKAVPYFYEGAVNKKQDPESIVPGGFPLEDLDKMAAYYYVFVVFSYEIIQR